MVLPILVMVLLALMPSLLGADDPDSAEGRQRDAKSDQLLQRDAPLDVLIEALDSDDFSTRIRAVYFIGYRGQAAKEAVPALVRTLEDSHMRESTLHALKSIGPSGSAAIPALFKALTAYPRQPATRWIAAHALANIGEAALPTLRKGTSSDNLYERLWCHAALARIEGPESRHLQVLAESMASKDKTTSLVAVRGLTMIGSDAKSVIPKIIDAMDIPTTPKTDLAVLLAQMGKDATPAIPQLVNLLDHSNAMTRQRAAYALSEIGGAELRPAVPGLIRMLTAKEYYVREMAAKALGTTGPEAEQSTDTLIDRLRDDNEHVRAAAATALGSIAPTNAEVQSALIDAMKDESGRVRSSVAPVLARHAPVTRQMIKVFIEASDDNWGAVEYACETFFARLEGEDRELIPKRFLDYQSPRSR
jgi:HEAT repeat protein